jgi:hypothetical protein
MRRPVTAGVVSQPCRSGVECVAVGRMSGIAAVADIPGSRGRLTLVFFAFLARLAFLALADFS